MSHPLDFIDDALAKLDWAELRRVLHPITGGSAAEIVLDGKRYLDFSSNDYLGLARDARLVAAAKAALDRDGVGSGASRLITGHHDAHASLEGALASLKGTEAALSFNSGYHANLGTIPALVGEGDVVLSDALNHASLIDGARLSRARIEVYHHGDLDDLARALAGARGKRRRLVLTDALFSMDGDLAPLEGICDFAEAEGAMVMVDEAHATGVFGARGAGVAEHLGVSDRIAVQMGTLGKALGAFGAYVAGEQRLRDYLVNRARSFVFTTGLPPAVAAAAEAAVGLVREDAAGLRARLWRNVARFRAGLDTLGLDYRRSPSQIFPIMVGPPGETMAVSAALKDRGIYAHGIRPPTVPEGTGRVRMTLRATHTEAHIDAALEALEDVLGPRRRAAGT